MPFKELLSEDDAVSPVIGVILMVAITVILAAVIATFVLGLGDQLSNTTPTTTFSFDYDSSVGPDPGGELTMTHAGGDSIQANELYIRGTSQGEDGPWAGRSDYDDGSRITAGQGLTIEVGSSDIVRLVYEGQSGGQSAVLERWPGPDA